MAQVLANGVVIPGNYGPPLISPADEQLFDHFHPRHGGHKKLAVGSVHSLSYTSHCVTCNRDLHISLAAAITFKPRTSTGAATQKLGDKIEDGRYPHTCPICNGPAYEGAYAFDCKRGCRR